MTDFISFDGTSIAWTEVGEGPPVILLHGLFSSAEINWLRYGTAAEIAGAGFRLILPDLRGHGQSDKPHDPARWPDDVLARDIEALIAHLGLEDFVLGGYSLGARTVVRLLARGLRPRRAILAGMGLQGIIGAQARQDFFLKVIEQSGSFAPGTAEYAADMFLRGTKADGAAIANLLRTQSWTDLETLRRLDTRTLVLAGEDDSDNGSAQELALVLPNAAHVSIPGNHMSTVTKPDFGAAIAAWLAH
ncbi:alpha/beta fold hydrolase [Polymorphobacter sp.]|uniref:alpha/beta fold hydrolase n=1 Tax=Polymorphobacter sp. TaxID=1909290 RepID=UPI003F702E4D